MNTLCALGCNVICEYLINENTLHLLQLKLYILNQQMMRLLTVQRVSDSGFSHGGITNLHTLVESLHESERESCN